LVPGYQDTVTITVICYATKLQLLHIAHLRQECHNSKFSIFELLVRIETFSDVLLTGTVSQRSLQNSPLESSCVVVALIENYSSSKSSNVSPEKSQILSCDTVVTNERYEL